MCLLICLFAFISSHCIPHSQATRAGRCTWDVHGGFWDQNQSFPTLSVSFGQENSLHLEGQNILCPPRGLAQLRLISHLPSLMSHLPSSLLSHLCSPSLPRTDPPLCSWTGTDFHRDCSHTRKENFIQELSFWKHLLDSFLESLLRNLLNN